MSIFTARLPLMAAILVSLAMVGSLTWQAYRLWYGDALRMAPEPASRAEQARQPQPATPDIDLARVNLFGQPGAQAEPEAVDTENLPETNLQLTLRGVLAAEGDQPASALVEDPRGQTEAYMIGDELPGDATLRSVHPNRVIIARDGKLENLYFPELDDASGVSIAANDTRDQPAYEPPPQSQPATGGGTEATEQRREEIRQRLDQLRERLRQNSN
ncbi:MAG: type II secretion system protein N [Marinobacter sp.]|uniref:type II secretion system protein N n=1 Tax=Marinobacter sp. TaxID=50741 RepID=UPI00299DC156|nr:type II secretion system protein N [Marinobacter sp.]MDX1634569.1 type II secretion system protein N [Marinobacter sp.]